MDTEGYRKSTEDLQSRIDAAIAASQKRRINEKRAKRLGSIGMAIAMGLGVFAGRYLAIRDLSSESFPARLAEATDEVEARVEEIIVSGSEYCDTYNAEVGDETILIGLPGGGVISYYSDVPGWGRTAIGSTVLLSDSAVIASTDGSFDSDKTFGYRILEEDSSGDPGKLREIEWLEPADLVGSNRDILLGTLEQC